jgi:hypothetical protein
VQTQPYISSGSVRVGLVFIFAHQNIHGVVPYNGVASPVRRVGSGPCWLRPGLGLRDLAFERPSRLASLDRARLAAGVKSSLWSWGTPWAGWVLFVVFGHVHWRLRLLEPHKRRY